MPVRTRMRGSFMASTVKHIEDLAADVRELGKRLGELGDCL